MATPREQLASVLKQARVKAGYTSHASLAKRLSMSRPVISKAENPSQPVPSDDVLTAWSEVTGVPLDKIRELARRARSGSPEWFVPYAVAEGGATTIRMWSPVAVPGLFQTPDYARAMLMTDPYTPERLDELVRARMERQKVIGKAYLVAVIDARVISVPMGGPVVMADQCAHLVTLAKRPDVDLYVLPEGVCAGLYGAFDIASNDGNFTVRMDALQDVTSTAVPLVELAMHSFERLLGLAMSPSESISFIRQGEERWKATT